MKRTQREKDLIKTWNEFEDKKIISMKELEELKKSMWKVLMEMDRMRKRLAKYQEVLKQ